MQSDEPPDFIAEPAPKEDGVIVIARDPRVVAQLLRAHSLSVRWFSTVAELECWRSAGPIHGFAAHVRRLVLTSSRHPDAPFPSQLQLAFDWLERQPTVPTLKALAESVCPRRTLFRLWSQSMKERPSYFLDALRAAYAIDLLQHGASVDEMMQGCGFHSLIELRQLVERWGDA